MKKVLFTPLVLAAALVSTSALAAEPAKPKARAKKAEK